MPAPVILARTVRFCVSPAAGDESASPRHNTFAAWPAMVGVGAYYELTVRCHGEPDAATGYLEDIGRIDAAVRSAAIPIVRDALVDRGGRVEPVTLLPAILDAVAGHLDVEVVGVEWRLTPHHRVALRLEPHDSHDDREPSAMSMPASSDPAAAPLRAAVATIVQEFVFAAAHRLHVGALDEAANRRLFGKCNNPNGHGHNYRLRVEVDVPVAAGAAEPGAGGFGLAELERIVDGTVVGRFDHTHLNLDTTEFAELNPSVEHIARVSHDLLVGPIAEAGGRLRRVTVWETEKTACTYPAG